MQRLCSRPFLHSDDSNNLVLSVKDDARVGQKMALARGHPMSSIGLDRQWWLLHWFELLLGTRSSLLWPTL